MISFGCHFDKDTLTFRAVGEEHYCCLHSVEGVVHDLQITGVISDEI